MKKSEIEEKGITTIDKAEYNIGDKVYVQKSMVLGQVKQLTDLLKTISMPSRLDVLELVDMLGDKLPQALAIVLVEKDSKTSLKDRDLQSIADELFVTIDTKTTMKVIDDFFDFNPIAYVVEKLSDTIVSMGYRMKPPEEVTNADERQVETTSTGSTESSSISQEETSSEEMKSVGGTP